MWRVGSTQYCGFGSGVDAVQVDMGALIYRQQHGRHRNVDILATPCLFALAQRGQNCDRRLQSGIDIGVRQWISEHTPLL